MVEHIENNIYCIRVGLPGNPLKALNAYVIKDGGRNLLIDTGFRRPECLADLREGLRELDVSMDDTDIFLTHLHADHSGLAPDLASPSTKIFIGRTDGGLLNTNRDDRGVGFGRLAVEYGLARNVDEFVGSASVRDFSPPPYEDYVLLDDGDELRYGGRVLRTVETPGHTPGHMCLWDSASGVMFLGDHVLFDITPNITAWPGFKDALGTYIHSLMDIIGYPVRLPLPAHRGVPCSMAERIGAIIEHHGVRVREALDTVELFPGSTVSEVASHLSWNIRHKGGWEGFPAEQKWFAVGETAAHLEYLNCRERVSSRLEDGVRRYYIGD